MFVGLMGKRSSKGGKYFMPSMKSVSLAEYKYRHNSGKYNYSVTRFRPAVDYITISIPHPLIVLVRSIYVQ